MKTMAIKADFIFYSPEGDKKETSIQWITFPKYQVLWSPLVRSAFCPEKVDLTRGVTLHPVCNFADFDWDLLKIDLTSKKILHPWTLQAGSSVLDILGM